MKKNKKIKIHVKNNHWAAGSFPTDAEGEKVFTIKNSDFEKAFYGPKGPPDLTGGGGEGQARELNRLYSGQVGVGGGGGTTVPPVVPPVDTENTFVQGSGVPFKDYYCLNQSETWVKLLLSLRL